MATGKNQLLTNIRGARAALAGLIHAWMDDVLARPVGQLFDTAELASAIATGIRGVAADPRNEEFLKARISVSVAELQDLKVAGELPERGLEAMRNLAAQPIVLGEELVAALLDHEAAHILLREVLQRSLLDFTQQVASLFPGGETAFRLVDKAREIAASAVGGDVGTSIEQRVNESVDEALAPAFTLTANRIADEEFARTMGDWRGHVLDVLLSWPTQELVGTLKQVDPEQLAAQLAALLQGIAEWTPLEQTIRNSLEATLQRAGDQSLRAMLSETSMEKDWRPALEKQLVEAAWPFVQSDAFEKWLGGVMKPARKGGGS